MTERQKVLIVDDKKENLLALRKVLRELDVEVVEATCGDEAMAATIDQHFAVAILDVMMPGMNGYELAEHLRGDERTQLIPIVFLTASFADEQHMFRGYEAGGVDYIVKPFSPEMLLGKVKIFLEIGSHRTHLEDLVQERTAALTERSRELGCLYAISRLVAAPCVSIDAALETAVHLIPPGFQYPEIACARIVFEGRDFATANFRETPWQLSADIRAPAAEDIGPPGELAAEDIGPPRPSDFRVPTSSLLVCYLEEKPASDEGPFLKEERNMIADVARQLGVMIERTRTEQAVRASEAQLSNALQMAHAGHWEYDVASDTFTFNDNLYRIFRTTAAEVGGCQMSSADYTRRFCYPDDAFIVGKAVQAAIESTDPDYDCQIEHRILYANGGVGYITVRFFIVKDSQGRTVKTYGVNQDITERRKAEEQIEHLNRVLRAMRDVNQLIVRERDPGTLIRRTCEILVEHRGYSGAMIILTDDKGKPRTYAEVGMTESFQPMAERLGQGILPPCCEGAKASAGDGVQLVTDRAAVCGACPRVAHCAHTNTMLMPLRCGEKTAGFLLVSVEHAQSTDADEHSLFAEVAGDIAFALHSLEVEDERGRAEEKLRESEGRHKRLYTMLRLMCDNLPEFIWAKDLEGRFLFANKSCCDNLLNARNTDEPIGRDDIYFGNRENESHPENPEYHTFHQGCIDSDNAVLKALEANRSIESGNIKGNVTVVDVYKAPLWDEEDNLIGTVGCARDITKERETENQLRQAQKMESVGRLAGGVAHDFNNLLMGVMNYVELCRDKIEPDHPIREWLDEITSDAQRSADLTRQLLAFARKQTVVPKVLDLNDTVSGMLKMLRRLIGEDIDLAWQPGANMWPVKLDPGQIDQILANLCVNARDAIAGVGKLTIETKNAAIDADYCAIHVEAVLGEYVMLAVSDNGKGMDRDTLQQIFEPFFTTKGVGEGTGLGLATVYGIVKQNNGFINVYSEPGQGTTFRIYLPRFVGEIAASSGREAPAAVVGGDETVLLVEDEKSIRVTTRMFLQDLGYTVLAAESPEAALRLIGERADDIHMLITDVVMPGMSGRDLADKLSAGHPELKVLYMSGYTANVIAHHGILDEGMQFLSKPITRDSLARKVREILGPGGPVIGQ